jgi:hypothetical protein
VLLFLDSLLFLPLLVQPLPSWQVSWLHLRLYFGSNLQLSVRDSGSLARLHIRIDHARLY